MVKGVEGSKVVHSVRPFPHKGEEPYEGLGNGVNKEGNVYWQG